MGCQPASPEWGQAEGLNARLWWFRRVGDSELLARFPLSLCTSLVPLLLTLRGGWGWAGGGVYRSAQCSQRGPQLI